MPRLQNAKSPIPDDVMQSIAPRPEEIAARAFDLYQRRGGADGAALEDWLEAERQLLQERREQLAEV